MEFRILGPLEVLDDEERPVELAAGRRRTLLALLLLHANEVVSTDRLIDTLWGVQPPETASKALQGHVSALRKALGAGRVETREPGYVLRVGPGELDAERFERLAEADPAAALALWRGDPLPEFAYADFARAEIERLNEVRLGCVEARIDLALDAGRHRELVPELERLSADNPLRERFTGQLMLALYRSGRQADALDVYRDTRESLVDALGIEPGVELRELEQSILRQDPSIAAPRRRGASRNRRRRWLLAAAAFVVAAAAAGGLLATLGRGGGPEVVPNSVVGISPGTNGVTSVFRLGRRPDQIVSLGDVLFVASADEGILTRIDTRTRATKIVRVASGPVALAVVGRQLWVGGHGGSISRFDTRTLRLVDRLHTGGETIPWLAAGGRSIWAVLPNPLLPERERALRLDATTGAIQGAFHTGALPSAVSFGGGAAWVSNFGSGTVSRVDARSGKVDSFRVQDVADLEHAYGALWILAGQPTTVRRVDPASLLTEAIIPLAGDCPWQIAAGAGALWTTSCGAGTVSRIDPRSNTVAATLEIGHRPLSVAFGRDTVWVGVGVGPSA